MDCLRSLARSKARMVRVVGGGREGRGMDAWCQHCSPTRGDPEKEETWVPTR